MGLGKTIRGLFIPAVCILLVACVNQASDTATVAARETGGGNGSVASVIWIKTMAGGLHQPWGLDFLPDGNILVSEKTGALKRITANSYAVQDIEGLPETVDAGQGGLLDKQVMLTAQPFYQERRHFGSRLLLDGGYLYITVGDRGHRDLAQSLQTHNGKVLRLWENGQVPEDNPFIDRAGARPEIWTYGHRNPQGIARNPLTYYVPAIGTGGMDFYVGKKYPPWKSSLLVPGLHNAQISRVVLKGDSIEKKTTLQMKTRVRDLQMGPDGFIYALAGDSRLVRLETESL